MTRLLVGPFNRVEGDLEVKLDVSQGAVQQAHVVSPLYRGFEQILASKDPRDALVFAPRICGICSVSQSSAAASAIAAVQSIAAPPNGELTANIILAAENIADHLTHFYMFFMPDFARQVYAQEPWFESVRGRFEALKGSAVEEVLPARATFLHIIGLLAGKWPHTLCLQPGGTTRSVEDHEVFRLSLLATKFRQFLEKTVFGADLEEIVAFSCVSELDRWLAVKGSQHSDFCQFLSISKHLELGKLGRTNDRFMSYGAYRRDRGHLFSRGIYAGGGLGVLDPDAISEDVCHSWMSKDTRPRHPYDGVTVPDETMSDGYTWCKAPRLSGKTVEVGALARQVINGNPLILDAVANTGGNVETRVLARLLEIALLVIEMQIWIAELVPGDPFIVHGEVPNEAKGAGLVEAARGSLGHWLTVRNGRIFNYQIVAPTTWNFSPRDKDGIPGPLEQALVGTPVRDGEREPIAVQHIVRSFDPCMVCTVH